MSGRLSRCGVSFPNSCGGVWPLLVIWCIVSFSLLVFGLWQVFFSVYGSLFLLGYGSFFSFRHVGLWFVCLYCICNPLRAAQRAMAAAPPSLSGLFYLYPYLIRDRQCRHTGAPQSPSSQFRQTREKRKEHKRKGKHPRDCLTGLPGYSTATTATPAASTTTHLLSSDTLCQP